MTKPIIVWSDPPSARRGMTTGKWSAHIEALKERPGQWACIRRHENNKTLNSMRNVIRTGRVYEPVVRPGRIEAVVRRTRDGDDYGLWARWVPPGGES